MSGCRKAFNQTLINGTYDPRCLKRYYFSDEVVDQLHLSDRIFQHILLKQLKPTFQHVMNKNVYHLAGPTGVKYATQRIRQILEEEKPKYFLRVDIRSYYASIPHFKLISDIKQYYHDPKVIAMLENIITNPIDTPRGTRNPSHGIALRGPLSQFFSALYLKPLDDSLSSMNIHYLRFQDDLIAFCKTKRQLSRCRKRMMKVLQERQLTLSRKKSRMGSIESGFHFLGVNYSPTQRENNTTATHANDDFIDQPTDNSLTIRGGRPIYNHQQPAPLQVVPHPRTLRKARENVKQMVADGTSFRKIRRYLDRYVMWWQNTSIIWEYQELLQRFIDVCWHEATCDYAIGLKQLYLMKSPRRVLQSEIASAA